MTSDTFTLRDAVGTEYRIVVTEPSGLEARGSGRTSGQAGLGDSSHLQITIDGTARLVEFLDETAVRIEPADEGSARRGITAHAVRDGDTLWVFLDGRVFTFEAEPAGRRRRARAIAGSLTAPMPATVRRIEAKPGQTVRRGDILIVLEAMKMELPVRAPADGTIARVNCREGELVPAGHELVELEP